jgi:hypothetical protein
MRLIIRKAPRTAHAITLEFFVLCLAAFPAHAQPPQPGVQPSPRAKSRLGLQVNKPEAFQGYTLVFPLQSTKTYLIDMQGRVVHEWVSKYTAGQEAYLLDNGHLLRPAKLSESEALFAGPAAGGRVQEFTWDGQLIWDFKFHNARQLQHHAITRLPNGNVLLVVWERKTAREAGAAGVKPGLAGSGETLADSIIEVRPRGKTGGEVVWEWHAWDHLIQDHDASKANYGDVAAHPELIDVNFGRNALPAFVNLTQFLAPPPSGNEQKKTEPKNDALEQLKGIGYIGAGGAQRFAGFFPDWTHVNAVAYNANLDQIMISPREFSEIWIIDHSTTRAEAAAHSGGRSGKGGDLLYRWGNPRAYRAGKATDQRLFSQHDAHWISAGLPGEGHLLVFSNGGGRPDGNYSSVDEVVLPVDAQGHYERIPGKAFGPDKPVWSYTGKRKSDFFAPLMSGAQRLPNGNTLICTGFSGTIFEVTSAKDLVWSYVNPAKAAPGGRGFGPPPGGPPTFGPPGGFGARTRSVQLFPGFLQFFLQLSPGQMKELGEFEAETSRVLDELLTDAQRKQLKEILRQAGPFGPGAPGGPPEISRVLAAPLQEKLKLTTDQKKQVDALQKDADGRMDRLLNADQKTRLKGMETMMKSFAGGPPGFGPGGPPGFGPGGPRGRGGFGPPGGFGGFGGPGGSAIFRAYRYGANHPGLAGKDLIPGKTIEERESLQAENVK